MQKVKDIRDGTIYFFIKFIEWYHNDEDIDKEGHIEHGPAVLCSDKDNKKHKISLINIEFIK